MQEENLIKAQNGLIYKTETILKHQNKLNEIRENKARQKLKSIILQKQKKNVKKSEIQRPEDFVHDYKNKQKNYAGYLKRKKKEIGDFGFKDNDLIFVVRIVGPRDLSENQKKLFKALRLQKVHEGTFFKVTSGLKKMIQSLENKLIYGKLNKQNLKTLISKRGFLRKDSQIEQIKSNKIVENILGEFGIICIEDIISEIYSGGDNFDSIKKFLCTFKLNKPSEGYGEKSQPLSKGGVWGNWKNELNSLIEKMI